MMRIGYGEDVHRLEAGRRLVLGGVEIPFEKGLLGHSDADVLMHAVMDALLGAAALGDIGMHFPDTDEAYRDADSGALLERTAVLVREAGYAVANVDALLVAERPKIAPYREAMRKEIAARLGLPIERVNVKATTTEGCGPEGRGECMRAHAVCLLERLAPQRGKML